MKKSADRPVRSEVLTARVTPERKARIEEMATQCNVPMSRALEEGATMYLEALHKAQERIRDQMTIEV